MLNRHPKTSLLAGCLALAVMTPGQAGWGDIFKDLTDSVLSAPTDNATSASSGLSDARIGSGILEALQVGVQRAIDLLGRDGGFLNDAAVRIAMPDSLKTVEKGLRAVGQDRIADEFIATMNSAAEQAVPETTQIFMDTIKGMSVTDARNILQGPDDAATQFFRQKNEQRLMERIRPIVEKATAESGVTSSYKSMVGNMGFLNSFVRPEQLDLDRYVTQKTLDGLFLKLAAEEGRIRQDPVARTTDLLKQVFK